MSKKKTPTELATTVRVGDRLGFTFPICLLS